MSRAPARVVEDTSVHPRSGKEQACVFAECSEGIAIAGPIWGTNDASRKRALAQLTDECDCGATHHYDEDE